MAANRTLHVRCNTWEQVEVFHTRKLRRGKLLSMKVPFQTEIGALVTLGLELPNQVVMAIDGIVQKASPIEGDTKTWIEVELSGFTEEVVARIRSMASGAAPPLPPKPLTPAPPVAAGHPATSPPRIADELPGDERQLFQHLTSELRRMRQVAVHEVLGVERDADPEAVRRGWMNLVRRHHPDLVARHQAPAITHLAEELTILSNRAYDRLRAALVHEGRARAVGSVLQQPAGWLVGFEDISSQEASAPKVARTASQIANAAPAPLSMSDTMPPPPSQGGESFESRARAMLGDGDANNAQEVLAAALCVYPRSRPLRSLYYVASAIAALQKGEIMLATSQLETALAHHDQCREASWILEHVNKHGAARTDEVRRFFR